jgi:hypothetical protein
MPLTAAALSDAKIAAFKEHLSAEKVLRDAYIAYLQAKARHAVAVANLAVYESLESID